MYVILYISYYHFLFLPHIHPRIEVLAYFSSSILQDKASITSLEIFFFLSYNCIYELNIKFHYISFFTAFFYHLF
jgi:hypothetical protein